MYIGGTWLPMIFTEAVIVNIYTPLLRNHTPMLHVSFSTDDLGEALTTEMPISSKL
jgi:hypothetical protein